MAAVLLFWDTNMAAVLLVWDTNMAAVTSCENTIDLASLQNIDSWDCELLSKNFPHIIIAEDIVGSPCNHNFTNKLSY